MDTDYEALPSKNGVMRLVRAWASQARGWGNPNPDGARQSLREVASALRSAGWMVVGPRQHETEKPALSLDYWRHRDPKAKDDKGKIVDFVRPKTWGELERDIKTVLRALPVDGDGVSVADIAEWVKVDPVRDTALYPARLDRVMPRIREAFAVSTQGHSEGYLIEIYGREWETRAITPLATIKFISGWHIVGEAAVRLNAALQEGFYQSEIVPDGDGRPTEDTEETANMARAHP